MHDAGAVVKCDCVWRAAEHGRGDLTELLPFALREEGVTVRWRLYSILASEEKAHALEHVLKTGVAACILTPRAHNPTGAALDASRARELRQLCDTYEAVLVIEDDYAGPIAGVSAYTVCHETKARWAVVRSVSKSLGPDLRLALLAGDATTVARVEGRQQLGAGWVSHILQGLVEALWSDATTVAHLQPEAAQCAAALARSLRPARRTPTA